MSRISSIHWFAPTLMLSASVAGVLFAIGHHLFYQSLDGKSASRGGYALFGASISAQETAIATGTAFAFIVKSCLVLAVAVAAVQVFWGSRFIHDATIPPTLQRLDSAYSANSDITALLNWRTWKKFPLLMVLALIGWLIPIAAIITPATLSILTDEVAPPPVDLLRVPNLDFRSLNFVENLNTYSVGSPTGWYGAPICYGADWIYGGPSNAVKKVVNAVMASGAILPIAPPPTTNASWTLQFDGPALRCGKAEPHAIAQVQNSLVRYYQKGQDTLDTYGYLAWVRDLSTQDIAPFQATSNRSNASFTWTPGDVPNPDLLFGTFPELYGELLTPVDRPNASNIGDNVYHCQFRNAKYHVAFNYTGGTQDVRINSIDDAAGDQPIAIHQSTAGPSAACLYWSHDLYTTGYCSECCNLCEWDSIPFSGLSYQAIVDAFLQNIKGRIYSAIQYSYRAEKQTTIADSRILSTALGQASDLAFLANPKTDVLSLSSAWYQDSDHLVPAVQGLITHSQATSSLTLSNMMEDLFTNFTVSLMSSPALQPNYSSITAPAPVNVTSHKYHNVYAYSRWKLWVPYGIAILLTLIAVCIGISAILSSGASYSQNFSTVFRVAKGAETSLAEIPDEELDGKDPLAKSLGEASIFLRTSGRAEKESGSYKRLRPSDASSLSSREASKFSSGFSQGGLLRSNTRVTL